ncbi:MAG: hypothetical protein WC233_10230 [Sphaerochaeta sp.]|jgi:hypothetical protein
MVRRRTLLLGIFILLVASALNASAAVTGELTFDQRFEFKTDGHASTTFVPDIGLTASSSSTKTIRGEISLGVGYAESAWNLKVRRAYLRARLPYGRMTVGKAPLPWGNGLIFNVANLTGRDPLWLTSYYLPFGALSFGEIVYLPAFETATAKAGARLYLSLGPFTVEGGYLALLDRWDGHRAALSVQGHMGVDWWAAAAVPISAWDETAFSGGLFYSHAFLRGGTLSLRPEAQADLKGAYNLALQALYTPDLNTSFSFLTTYISETETLLIQGGGSLSLPEALVLTADIKLSFTQWAYTALALELGCSWRF